MTTEKLAGMAAIVNQEQQRVTVGPGGGHFIYVRQVSYDAATMQRDMCARHVRARSQVAHAATLLRHRRRCC